MAEVREPPRRQLRAGPRMSTYRTFREANERYRIYYTPHTLLYTQQQQRRELEL